jgi:hypothetical protein
MRAAIIVLATLWLFIFLPLQTISSLYAGRFLMPRPAPDGWDALHFISWVTEISFFLVPVVIVVLYFAMKNAPTK